MERELDELRATVKVQETEISLLRSELERNERIRAQQRAAMMHARNEATCCGQVKRLLDAALGILEHGSCPHQ